MANGKTYKVDGIPYPMSEDEYNRWHRPSFFDTAQGQFASLPEKEKRIQALRRAEYGIISLYEVLVAWFCNDEKQFRTSSVVVSGFQFGWGREIYSSFLAFKKWIPQKDPAAIRDIAKVITCGGYDIAEQARRKAKTGYGGYSDFEKLRDIHEIYERACWDYTGRKLPKPPILGGWKRCLRWFEECRDMVGATSMLEAYAEGVPVEDIVLTSVEDEQREWYFEKWRVNDPAGMNKPPRFPNLTS